MNPVLKRRPSGTQVLATARRDGSRVFNDQGELNAGSKKEALNQLINIMAMMSEGKYVTEADDKRMQESARAEYRELLVAAYKDKQGDSWQEMGSDLAGRIYEALDREGFMRRLTLRSEVAQGGIPRIPFLRKNVVGFVATGPSQSAQIMQRDDYITPPEFYVRGHVFVEEKEITQGIGDVLETKYIDGQEAIMVQEDRTWKAQADNTIGVANDLLYMAGQFSPDYLTTLTSNLTRWHLQPSTLLMASDILPDVQSSNAFSTWFDPVTKLEIVQTGSLGKLLGLDFITDAYRHPTLHVLNSGEVYALGAPNTLGAYTDRGPVQATAIDGHAQMASTPGRGWNFFEQISLTLINSRSVAKGTKS